MKTFYIQVSDQQCVDSPFVCINCSAPVSVMLLQSHWFLLINKIVSTNTSSKKIVSTFLQMLIFAIFAIIFIHSFTQNIQTHGCRYLSTSLQLQLCIPASNNSPLYAELLAVSVLQLEMPNVLFKLKSSMFCCIGSTD